MAIGATISGFARATVRDRSNCSTQRIKSFTLPSAKRFINLQSTVVEEILER